jgi:rhodanese-related sulfurtransferase
MRTRSSAAAAAMMALVLAVLGAGCNSDADPGDDISANAESGTDAPVVEPYARLDPNAFAEGMKEESAVVVNVHIPYEGELENTDEFIAYDKIVGDSRLPKDKDQQILLYCKSGRMSEEAGAALAKEGYTKLAHLEGGMNAWEAAGKTLIQNPAHAADSGSGGHKM